jgi:hypothetical protein
MMTGQGRQSHRRVDAADKRRLGDKLDAAAWALFLIWVGIALLADVGIGIGLLGVGVITLGAQVARRMNGLDLEGFWLIVGLLFVAGGIWKLSGVETEFPLFEICLIVIGAALLYSVVRGKHPRE